MTTRNYDLSTITTSLCQSHMFFKVSDKMAYANIVDPYQIATQIRLLLQEQSDLGLHVLPFH